MTKKTEKFEVVPKSPQQQVQVVSFEQIILQNMEAQRQQINRIELMLNKLLYDKDKPKKQ